MTLRKSFHGFAVSLKTFFSVNILPSKLKKRAKTCPEEAPLRSLSNDFIHPLDDISYFPTRILCNFHRNRCVHFLPTVNGTISSTETIHCQEKNLATTTNKDKPIAGVSKKNCENTRADKRPPGCFRSTCRPCTFSTRLADPLRVTRLTASFTIQR